ncbi:MAG: carbohydrate kinase family protein [Candidatus Latescibacteria bacterium]|nr:carbohydrate kinase family protein [Candidatus Latescibacterota bacterium]
MAVVPGLVEVASNAVLDVLVRDVRAVDEPARDGWGANVQVLARPVDVALGGCGAAAAYVLGRLGQRVRLNTNLGGDAWGQMLRGWLASAGVELRPTALAASAVHLIQLSPEGRRRSYYYTGEKVVWSATLEGELPAWYLAAGYGKVDAEDLRELEGVFARLRQAGTMVVFDPGPWFKGRVATADMRRVWGQVHTLVATEEELRQWWPAADAEVLAKELLDLGPAQVVVKRGPEGAVCGEADGGVWRLPTTPVAGANTVGAGDTFNGRLVAGLCRGEELRAATGAALQLATQAVRRGRGVLGALD